MLEQIISNIGKSLCVAYRKLILICVSHNPKFSKRLDFFSYDVYLESKVTMRL